MSKSVVVKYWPYHRSEFFYLVRKVMRRGNRTKVKNPLCVPTHFSRQMDNICEPMMCVCSAFVRREDVSVFCLEQPQPPAPRSNHCGNSRSATTVLLCHCSFTKHH